MIVPAVELSIAPIGGHKVAHVRLRHHVLPLKDTTWANAAGAFASVPIYVVEVETDHGARGYGYIDTTARWAGSRAIQRAAVAELTPAALGRDPFDIDGLLTAFDRALPEHRHAKAGIETALFDVMAQISGKPLHELFGGARRDAITTTRMIPIKEPAVMAALARGWVSQGFRALKLKIAGDGQADINRVAAVRDAVGPGIGLSVDANQGYPDLRSAIWALKRMTPFDIALAEEPLYWQDRAGKTEIRKETGVRLEADESIRSVQDVADMIEADAADTFNLRVNFIGGFRNILRAMRLCESAGRSYRFSAYGSELASAQAAHLACIAANMHFASDLAEFDGVTADPFRGLATIKDTLVVPAISGIGVTYDAPADVDFEVSLPRC